MIGILRIKQNNDLINRTLAELSVKALFKCRRSFEIGEAQK
jgi:hypothetical protein